MSSDLKNDVEACQILVVDDDPRLQMLIKRTLEPGARVIQKLDGNSELELDGIDAVLLDYLLPGVDGLSILEKIKSDYPDLPVLFMTGFGDLKIARRALALGASEYLPKPFLPDDLRAAVARWVDDFEERPQKSNGVTIAQRSHRMRNEAENFLTATDQEGHHIKARVLRYNARTVVVEMSLDAVLTLGDELTRTFLTLGNRSMEVAGARVVSVSQLSDRYLVEIELPGIWNIRGYAEDVSPAEISKMNEARGASSEPPYSRFEQGSVDREVIPEEYRITVTDLASILQEIFDDLEVSQSRALIKGDSERVAFEEGLIEQAQSRYFPAVTEAMARFETASEESTKVGMKNEFQAFAKRSLYPFLLCSPFLSRVIHKPIGVPGDYGILGQILGNPYDGHSLFGRMLNGWVLSSHPAVAYRHRVTLLGKTINEAIVNAQENGERPEILSMASGVAFEIQQFIRNCKGDEEVTFQLDDFSASTLEEAKMQYSECRQVVDPPGVITNFQESSVIELANQARAYRGGEAKPAAKQYHFVYCAGLFDYLSDRLCKRVTDYLYTLVKPGGTLIVSNYTPVNSLKNFMEFVLDWSLVYRSNQQFDELISKTAAKGKFTLETDVTGAEVYAIIKKPK